MAFNEQSVEEGEQFVASIRQSLRKTRFRLERALANCDSILGEVENADTGLSRLREIMTSDEALNYDDPMFDRGLDRSLKLLDKCNENFGDRASEAVSLDDNLEALRYVLDNAAYEINILDRG